MILANKYRIDKVLGKGSYGTVYLAEQMDKPGTRRALKEIEEARMCPEDRAHILELFIREAEMLTCLKHPGLPLVTDFFSLEDRHYLVMEFIPGKNLEAMRRGALAPEPVIEWALQLASIIEYLHEHRPEPIIFRDLKPSNVMLSAPTGRIMLVDFGIARYFNPHKLKDTQFLGTPGFSPPEQYGSGQSDQRSDIYSFGATLYFLLTDGDICQYYFKMPPLRRQNPLVPPALESVIMKCLSLNPGERFQSMTEILMELEEIRLDMEKAGSHGNTATPGELFGIFSKFSLSTFPYAPLRFRTIAPLQAGDVENIGTFSSPHFSGLLTNCHCGLNVKTAALVTLEGAPFPKFYLRSQSLLDLNIFGRDPDIDFSENPDFSASFFLTGPDRKAIEDFFRPELIEIFSEKPMLSLKWFPPNNQSGVCWIVEAEGPHLIFYYPEIPVPKESIQQFIDYARKVMTPFVKKALQSRRKEAPP
ncbi:MAG: serine/threonine-protein kinase [Candidatus Eremiobacteraeota bacterium]|nr:serine/threonine-protein kinase [Candidatus Eremiobacteraeota bacterium]